MTLRTIVPLLLLLLAPAALAERGPRIVIDPGHGGSQEGAKGPGSLQEKEVVLQLAKRLRERIEGIETYFLSATASGAGARSVADRENADGPAGQSAPNDSALNFILHDLVRMEAHTGSSRLAYSIHEKLIAATGAADRGVLQAPFFVLTGVEAPAVLIEIGYISHPQEGVQLGRAEYQDKLVGAITEGVKGFLGELRKRDRPGAGAAEGAPVATPASP